MYLPHLIALLFFTVSLALAGYIEPWSQQTAGTRRANALSMLIGDSRRLFANHFFAKADAYFHRGYYPSIFDRPHAEDRTHMQAAASTEHHEASQEHEEEEGYLGPPRDWIDAFGRHFYPSEHNHLEGGDYREVLPWLRVTASLDPHKIETYVIGSFALRTRLNKPKEAEQFLREGLHANPDSYEILFELGRIRDENEHDSNGARNLWELALKKWKKQQADGKQPDEFVYAQILGFLGNLEERERHYEKAIQCFEMLKEVSPAKSMLENRIQELREKQSSRQ